MGSVAWIVEHFYPMLVPIVILAATYIIILRCQRSLLIPFILGFLVMAAVFYLTHWWPIFFISLPSMFMTLEPGMPGSKAKYRRKAVSVEFSLRSRSALCRLFPCLF